MFPRIPTMKFAAILALSLGAVNASPATYEPTYAPTYAPTESQTEPPTEPPTQDACAQCAANGALACFRDGVYNPPGELKAQCDGVSFIPMLCGPCVTPPATYEPTYAPTYAPTESQTEPPTEPPTQDACAQCAANGALACFRDGVYNPHGVYNPPGELKAQCDGVSHCGRCVTPPSRSPTSNGPAQENCRDCTTATANRSLLFARLPCCSN